MDSNAASIPDLDKLIECPFCEEQDFDLQGLKGHLEYGDCVAYKTVQIRPRIFG